jgi:hypothetical protein
MHMHMSNARTNTTWSVGHDDVVGSGGGLGLAPSSLTGGLHLWLAVLARVLALGGKHRAGFRRYTCERARIEQARVVSARRAAWLFSLERRSSSGEHAGGQQGTFRNGQDMHDGHEHHRHTGCSVGSTLHSPRQFKERRHRAERALAPRRNGFP